MATPKQLCHSMSAKSPAKAAQATPLRRSARSASRKRDSSVDLIDLEETTATKPAARGRSNSRSRKADNSATPTKAKAAAKSPAKKSPAKASKSPAKRSNSKKQAPVQVDLVDDDEEEEVIAPKRRGKTPTKSPAKVEQPPARRSSSRSRVSAKDQEDELEVVAAAPKGKKAAAAKSPEKPAKKAASKSPAKPKPAAAKAEKAASPKKSQSPAPKRSNSKKAKATADDEEESAPVQKKKPVRTRSRSRGRANNDSDDEEYDDEDFIKPVSSPVASPRRSARVAPSSPVSGDEDDEPRAIMHREKEPIIFFHPLDIVWLGTIFVFPLMLALFNMWCISPQIRDVLYQCCPTLLKLSQHFHLNTLTTLAVNAGLLILTCFFIAYKLRRSNVSPRAVYRITSLIFRGFVSLALLITWFTLSRYDTTNLNILQALALALFPFAFVECFYTLSYQTGARWIEQGFLAAISYFLLFKLPTLSTPVLELLTSAFVPVIVVYLTLNVLLAGDVAVMATTNKTQLSMAVTSVAHALVWLHLILIIGGPLFILYFEFFKDLTVLQDRTRVTVKAIAVFVSIVLHFANYADALSTETVRKD